MSDRRYKTLLLVDLFECSPKVVDTAIKGVFPEFLNRERFHFTQDTNDTAFSYEKTLKLLAGTNTVIIIDVKYDPLYPMLSYKACTEISDYLLRNPHNLDIPLVILNYESSPERCLYMCDYAITGHSKVNYPVPDNCIEVIRSRTGSTGRMLKLD